MSVIKLKGTQAACGTATGTASTFGSATCVRLINGHTAAHLVTLEQTDGTDIGTVTIAAGESILLKIQLTRYLQLTLEFLVLQYQ